MTYDEDLVVPQRSTTAAQGRIAEMGRSEAERRGATSVIEINLIVGVCQRFPWSTHWNHLGSFKIYRCLDSTSRDSDVNDLGCTQSFKSLSQATGIENHCSV